MLEKATRRKFGSRSFFSFSFFLMILTICVFWFLLCCCCCCYRTLKSTLFRILFKDSAKASHDLITKGHVTITLQQVLLQLFFFWYFVKYDISSFVFWTHFLIFFFFVFFFFLIFFWKVSHHHYHHLSLNREGRWGTTDDFTSGFLHLSVFSTALWDLANSWTAHSVVLSSHLFLCLPCLYAQFGRTEKKTSLMDMLKCMTAGNWEKLRCYSFVSLKESIHFIIIINPFTARVVGAPQMIL